MSIETTSSTPLTAVHRRPATEPNPRSVTELGSCDLPTQFGRFRLSAFEVSGVRTEFVCLSMGEFAAAEAPLVRLHSECLTGDAFGSLRCDCGEQLEASLGLIAAEGTGLVLYLRQEGRGIGIVNKIRAYALQDGGLDTVDANIALGLAVDRREYGSAATVLHHLGLSRIRLLTNNPSKCEAVTAYGIEVVERIGLNVAPNPTNLAYLRTKARRMGHFLEAVGLVGREDRSA